MKLAFLSGILAILILSSCTKNNAPAYNPSVKSSLSVEFDNIVGAADLALNSGAYTDGSGETFTVTKLRYYVSNFILTATDGSIYTVPPDSCYFLIDESDEETHEPVMQVPEGVYKTLSFIVGVDSLRSTMDVSKRTGTLDPLFDGGNMYWGTDSGYVFFDMEGNSPSAPSGYSYRIGGYGAPTMPVLNNIERITLDLSARGEPNVKAGLEPNLHLMVDILKLFNGTSTVSIAAHPQVGFVDYSTIIANNYTDMFRHDHTEN